jgi:hypothetical protein
MTTTHQRMKDWIRTMRRVCVPAALAMASFVISPAAAVQAAPILATPPGTAAVGETFLLEITIADAVDVWSWQFDLAFDPALVRATAVGEGPFFSSAGTSIFGPGVMDNAAGLVSLVTGAYVDLPPTPAGGGVLASIEFVALAPGAPAFLLSNAFLNLLPVGFEVTNGSFAITDDAPTPVPEPATLLAVASGLMLIHRRRMIQRQGRG